MYKTKLGMRVRQADVSVIIPCYCSVETVERALDSVVGQSMAPAEIILVDDASDDNGATISCLQQLCDKFGERCSISIQLIALRINVGPSGARNAAWEVATASYIAFLDADDAWHPKKIEIQYLWMQENPEVALSGHYSAQLDAWPPSLGVVPPCTAKACNFHLMLFRNPLVTSTVMMRRDTPCRFVVSRRYSEDYLLWLQIASAGAQVFVIDAVLAYSFKPVYGVKGLSGQIWLMELGVLNNFWRLYRCNGIGGATYLAASLFSLLKYLRRLIVVAIRGRVFFVPR
ncbi:MAG: glycosyltransferase family 2 protein [Mariprofundaceae bacterium]